MSLNPNFEEVKRMADELFLANRGHEIPEKVLYWLYKEDWLTSTYCRKLTDPSIIEFVGKDLADSISFFVEASIKSSKINELNSLKSLLWLLEDGLNVLSPREVILLGLDQCQQVLTNTLRDNGLSEALLRQKIAELSS